MKKSVYTPTQNTRRDSIIAVVEVETEAIRRAPAPDRLIIFRNAHYRPHNSVQYFGRNI